MTTGRRAVLAAILVNLMGALPLFLTGGMSVQIARQFQLAPESIGALASVFALCSALGSAPLGGQVRNLGVRRSIWVTTGTSITSLLLAASSNGVLMLTLALAIGGFGNALGQPAGNALIAAQVRPERFGLGFAIKQSGIPLATAIGGFSVPLVALTVGWRFAYLLATIAALTAAFIVPPDRASTAGRSEQRIPAALVRPLWFLVAGLLAAVVAATSIGALGSAGAVAAGLSEGSAGYLVAVGGMVGLTLRLAVGVAADRRPFDPLVMASAMICIGAVGWLLMVTGGSTMFVVGLIVANAFGWGWPGLQQLAMARRFPTATAAASGVAQTGVALGLMIGPAILGFVAHRNWSLTWLVAGCSALLGAAVIRLAAARIPVPDQVVH